MDRRSFARAPVSIDVRLARRNGPPLTARTLDLCPGGARITCDRPLRVDEELHFDIDLPVPGRHVDGTARVLRHAQHNVYALRFEDLPSTQLSELRAFVTGTSQKPL